jgi:hypothetical protein
MKIRNNIQTGLNTYASYSVAGLVNQNLSGVNTTRLMNISEVIWLNGLLGSGDKTSLQSYIATKYSK